MKLPINIEELLGGRAVEDDRIEYKTGWNPDAIYRSICAFANDFDETGDGYIVMGVMEKNGFAFCHPEFVSEKVVLNKDVVKDVTKDSIHELTERQKVILMVIKENPLVTIPEMSLKMNVVTRTIKRDIEVLKSKGFLKREGSRKEGHWEIVD